MGKISVWLGVLAFSAMGLVWGDVYKYTDANGNVIFTDKPVARANVKLAWRRASSTLVEENQKRVLAYGRVPSTPAPKVGKPVGQRRAHYEGLIRMTAARNRLSPELLHAVIRAESAYDAAAVSPAGAIGLMQLMPATAERYGVADIWDPVENLQGGAAYLRDLLELFDQNLRLALAGYNAGENAVIRYGRKIPPYPETQSYVRKVLQFLWAEQASVGRLSMR